jgi:peptidoglycan hydrolase-like protein with peptidoglycan-binding domain
VYNNVREETRDCHKAGVCVVRRFATYVIVLVAACISRNAAAQNAGDFINMFSGMMRAAIIENARTEWSKLSPNETSCIEQGLQQQGYSIDRAVQNGIAPQDPRVSGIRSGCRASTVSLPNPSESIGNIGNISATPTFDCTKARTPTARIICLDQTGAKADWDLTSAFWARYFTLDASARDGFSQAEDNWFPSLNRPCQLQPTQDTFSGTQRQCVLGAYARRATLFRSQLNGDALYESQLTPEQHAQIQAELIRRGLLNDAADGEFGQNTRNAIKAFQEQSGFPNSDFLTTHQLQQLLPPGASATRNRCQVTDPTGTPLNIRAAPNGAILGNVSNGVPVHILQTTQDNAGRSWVLIERLPDNQSLGWVFRNYITCGEVTARDNTTGNTSGVPPPPPTPLQTQPPQDTLRLKQARVFLEDAHKFIAEQNTVPGISAIANEAANLKIALSIYDEARAVQSMAHLNDLLKPINGFDEFEKQQQADRQREDARQLAEASSEGDKNIYFIDRYLKENLGDPKTATLLKLREQIDSSKKKASIEEITKGNDSLQAYITGNDLSNAYQRIVSEYASPTPKLENAGTLEDRLGITDKTRFVVEGPADEIALLYNASPTAPSVWVNVRGDIVFQSDTAALCFSQAKPEVGMFRYTERILGEQGAKTIIAGAIPCDLSAAGTSIDIIAFERGELLKQREDYIRALVKLIGDNSFRKCKMISDYASLAKQREILSLQIESDVEKNARKGFGVITVSDSPAVCVINSSPPEQVDGIKELLRRNQYLIAPKLASDWQYVDASPDLAFRGLQRRQCGYVAGGADDLRALTQALRREQIEYRFAAVWFEVQDVEQATFDTRDAREQEIRKKAESDRVQKEQQALEEKRQQERQSQKSVIEQGLRQKNAVKARALMNSIHDFVRGLAEKRLNDTSGFFPNYSNWLNKRFADQWETFNVSSDIADFGTAQWNGRPLEAIIVKSVIQQKNRILGKYEDHCYVFGLVDDSEFTEKRDQFAVDCDSGGSFVSKWKVGEAFQSQWNAN